MNHNLFYHWEMQTSDGNIKSQYDENGNEQSWKELSIDKIMRVSFIPQIPILPRHDIFIDIENGDRFVKRFGRGFMKMGDNGINLKKYLNCVVTNKYRFYVFSDGRTMITHKDYEVYL